MNIDKLLDYLQVEQIDRYVFVGKSPKSPSRIFGGQVLAQCLNAASRTVSEDRLAHSLHAYFLRPGDPTKQILFEVDPIRDGGSFTTRRIIAKQDGIPIFNMSASFHQEEVGFTHQMPMPEAPVPETIETDEEYWERNADRLLEFMRPPSYFPVERRNVHRRDYLNPEPMEPHQQFWFRVKQTLPDDLRLHQVLLAYISDYGLLGTAMYPHPISPASDRVQAASLDHGLWFHRPFRADDYILADMDSPSAFGNRGFSRGSFYSKDGTLIASSVQESLLRVRPEKSD